MLRSADQYSEIRHEDVDDVLEQGEALERVVRARVVDDGQVQAKRCGVADGFDDLRRHVLGCDEVDVVAPLGLEPQHHGGDLSRRRSALGCRLDILTDVEVLAEDTAQIAVREEDRTRAIPSSQTVFLAKMREAARDHGVAARLARRPAILETVHAAITRAGTTIRKRSHGATRAAGQRVTPQPNVGRASQEWINQHVT